jgi:hypothetical protein
MTETVELSIETANHKVIGPDHAYDPDLEYGEIIATCEVEVIEDTRIIAGYSGPEYIEIEETLGCHQEFHDIIDLKIDGEEVSCQEIYEEIEAECIRQIDNN